MVVKFKSYIQQKFESEISKDNIVIMTLALLVFSFMIWSILHTA